MSEMRDQSYIMLGVLNSKKGLWITQDGPIICSKNNLQKTEAEAFKYMAEFCQDADKQGDMLSCLKAVLELQFPKVKAMPRSVVIIGQGNLNYQADIENLITTSLDKNNSRISAVGIGNGTSDSFLRTVTSKGAGLFDIVNDVTEIEKKMEIFMKRLRMPVISNLQLDWSEDSAVAFVLPTIKPTQTFLKGAQMELFVYLKEDTKAEDCMKHSIKLSYMDLERGKPVTLHLMFKSYKSRLESALHKLVINQLLLSERELEGALNDSVWAKHTASLKEYLGGDSWASTLAVENQILSKHTAYIAVPFEHLPENFDKMAGDLALIDESKIEGKASKKLVVPNIIPADIISGSMALSKAAGSSSKTVLHENISKSSFSYRNFKIVDSGVKRLTNSCSIHGSLSTTTTRRSDSDKFDRADTEASNFDQHDLLTQIHEVDDEDNIDTKAKPTTSLPAFGTAKNKDKEPGDKNPPGPDHMLSEIIEGDEEGDNQDLTPTPKKPDGETPQKIDWSVILDSKDIPQVLAEKQQADGTFVIEAELLKVMRIDPAVLAKIASDYSLTESTVFVILASLYLTTQAFISQYQLTIKFLLKNKIKKRPDYDEIVKRVTAELKMS